MTRIMRHNLPHAAPGQVIGLLGGSFDPAHEGHAHITREALKRFGLDRVWWLISPRNPLKSNGPAPIGSRMARAREVMQHPKVEITRIEELTGTQFTADTIAALMRLYPGVRFVWLMGADNLATFHRWDNWRWIMEHVPVGVIARPGDRVQARMSPAALIYRHARLRGRDGRLLANLPAPVWTLINAPMRDISSSQIRARGNWGTRAKADHSD